MRKRKCVEISLRGGEDEEDAGDFRLVTITRGKFLEMQADLARITAERDRLREAAYEYAKNDHSDFCSAYSYYGFGCTCGLDELRAALGGG